MTDHSSTVGWTSQQWREFHRRASADASLARLLALAHAERDAGAAWISVASDEHIEHQWRVLQSRGDRQRLPLYGVPVAVKDNIDVRGLATTAACPSFAYTAAQDATAVRLLRDAGAVILGKTNMDQFATGLVGTRSPYGSVASAFSSAHAAGGSSSGSAVVVARGAVPLTLGTDTAGSGRVPAALNNLVGVKPTRGTVSCTGVVPACRSLDCVSVFARDVADAHRCLRILARPDGSDPYSRPSPADAPRRFGTCPVVGVPREAEWFGESQNAELFAAACQRMRAAGARVVEVDPQPLLDLGRSLYEGPWVAERYAAMRAFYSGQPPRDTLDPTVTGIITSAGGYSAADVFDHGLRRQKLVAAIEAELAGVDALLVPTCPLNPTLAAIAAEPLLVNARQGMWTNFVNLADLAAVAIPAGFRRDGLPQGVTLVGRKFSDLALLELGSRLLRVEDAEPRRCGALPAGQALCEDEVVSGSEERDSTVLLAVVGAHLRGLALHWQLDEVQAEFVREARTAPSYRLYALPKTGPVLKPALRRVCAGKGAAIELEVYSVPEATFGRFVAMVPAPLAIGSVELESGEYIKSFVCEEDGYIQDGTVDITHFGGFRRYVEHLRRQRDVDKPFDTVLVANRGEIAVRIIRTLKRLGIRSVAVYSDPDRHSQHVRDADVAVALGGSSAAETYLDIDKILAAAKKTDTQAIIPGYGFLSENATFAERCGAEGIVFVGPSGDSIRKLGLKHWARELAASAGVPLTKGTGLLQSASAALEAGEEIGYPLMVKSTAGGGGIGLQRVDSAAELAAAFEQVQRQGELYFTDSGVFLESFIARARHVEVQIMGDGHGRTVALGERDCSLQRRNQKIIEETPAPNLPAHTRQKMRQAAQRLCSAVKYKCAGTVEFMYDEQKDEFYFLEVNTRLQVEHPITEMVTGLDLVEWMLRIAANTPPDFDAGVEIEGVSMEARVYAENPVKGFTPSPGLLTEVVFPSWARVDTWILKGTRVAAEYDPTLAKIIVHGKDREDAVSKLLLALSETRIAGCMTNLDYLKSIASSEEFRKASVFTRLLNDFEYTPTAFEVKIPGAYTTIQDYPGRVGYWRIGVPPSGPMDSYSFRLANRVVGNDSKAAALEITLNGPELKFHSDAVIAVTGGAVPVTLNGKPVLQYVPLTLEKGDVLKIGKLESGSRAYLAVRGGIDVPEFLGSRSTFAMGGIGGHNGRVLAPGDVLFINKDSSVAVGDTVTIPSGLQPVIPRESWKIGLVCGPHGSPDFFKREALEEFFSSPWKVHYNSNRFGIRLIGPKPKWARSDGGEAGLHPSNTHDYVYSVGAINFTGDEPVIIAAEGPSLGGFVCAAVVPEAELWKVGQLKPGDTIKFVPISVDTARALKRSQDAAVDALDILSSIKLDDSMVLPSYQDPVLLRLAKRSGLCPKVTFRQSGDRYILIEYGENEMDINISYRIKQLQEMVTKNKVTGIVEMSQGIRSLLVEYNGYTISQEDLLSVLSAYELEINFDVDWKVKAKLFRLPMAFEDSKTLEAVRRYQETIRSDAPWLPSNADFVANVNGITRADVRDLLYSATFMVLGLGDVFLGAPCAVPLDPRQRLLGTKYNPSRTYTPNGVVGIGGMYMCIYCTDSPGGYQLMGRTIPIWNRLQLGEAWKDHPWLLTPFDQVEFYPVSEERINELTEEVENGTFELEVKETVFDNGAYNRWLEDNRESIQAFKEGQSGERAAEFARLIKVANSDLETAVRKEAEPVEYPEDAHMVYSEYAGRFWKQVVSVGDKVKEGDKLVIIEAMKTEMVVSATADGEVINILHANGDMVDAGNLVVVLKNC
ncbi:ADR051Cp [Eremothecium gossypii ATCC 10895]|uniref:Urea amidolyase n=1 Tax=Eremothecium gossypii (strain ATCC 10895 / CBS 109.51 / FGSC 9923 / NRRL Y-1056) TaxID=284811 RepID=Q75A67_EREGS|nr:ADR051Cp [Eremothecium gossypii ATCC 10895]AAS51971.2 ADR051Cp [Eremothecium gossypii ATCC 10895]